MLKTENSIVIAISSKLKFLLISLVLVVALGCASCSTSSYAPVNNGTYPLTKSGNYRVRHGDTLYSIAFAFGYDYRTIAKLNGIGAPYHVQAGRLIHIPTRVGYLTHSRMQINRSRYLQRRRQFGYSNYLAIPQRLTTQRPFFLRPPLTRQQKLTSDQTVIWHWPAVGRILNYYSPTTGNKGINIVGTSGESINAAASGIVVYAGTGLRAYGKLIIIKHNNTFLSAYAHNQIIFVREGQAVRSGQKIALMGNTGAARTMLHFEIRKAGQSVNPIGYLPIK